MLARLLTVGATALAALAAAAATARADAAADVRAAIDQHLASFGSDTAAALADLAVVHIDDREFSPGDAGNYGVELTRNWSGHAKFTLKPLTIVVTPDGHAAWFHGRARLAYKEVVGEGIDDWATPREIRISGVAVNDGGWKLAHVAYANVQSDAKLFAQADWWDPPLHPATGAPLHFGVEAIDKAVDAWFPGGLAASASAGAQLVANGTSSPEWGGDRAHALKLAKAWDHLELGASEIKASSYGTLGFVRAVVLLPVKSQDASKGTVAAEMVLHAVVVQEGGTWRWVSLDWAAR